MAVTKRTRFEVLRRDNHACRYCGSGAPDVKLTVDHVLPVALGGTDDPSNLVACCSPCNSGKSSTSPDENLVSDVNQDVIRWAAARKQASDERLARRAEIDRQVKPFLDNWMTWKPTPERWLPSDWKASVRLWLADGLSIEEIIEASDIAWENKGVKVEDLFRYTAGVVRHKIAELDKATRAILSEDDGDDEGDDPVGEAWFAGYDVGVAQGKERSRYKFADVHHRLLCSWIDTQPGAGIYGWKEKPEGAGLVLEDSPRPGGR